MIFRNALFRGCCGCCAEEASKPKQKKKAKKKKAKEEAEVLEVVNSDEETWKVLEERAEMEEAYVPKVCPPPSPCFYNLSGQFQKIVANGVCTSHVLTEPSSCRTSINEKASIPPTADRFA